MLFFLPLCLPWRHVQTSNSLFFCLFFVVVVFFNVVKGQMNQKIEIFSFVALPSPNAKKNHP